MECDLLILGGGPGGLTAGMYASRAGIPVLLIEKGIPGGQMTATELVDNYPGFVDPILGMDLSEKMEAQARKFGVEIQTEEITRIEQVEKGFQLTADSGKIYSCRALIIATGASPVKLGIPGEIELAGKGVSYCAVCDGPFFRDLEVAVIGGGDSACEEASYLSRLASKVHLIHRRDNLRAVQHIQEKTLREPNIEIHWSSLPVRVVGDREVKGLVIRSVKDGSEQELPVGGVFFYVGLYPNTKGFKHLVETDAGGFILTDERMACSRPGVFAAGDVRAKQLRQISTAVGDGATAAYTAEQYLQDL